MTKSILKQAGWIGLTLAVLTMGFSAFAADPVIIVPKNGATGVDPRAYIYWSFPFEQVTLAQFKVYVAPTPTPLSSVAPIAASPMQRTATLGGLMLNQAYQVIVVAEDANPALSTTSTVFSFTTTNNALPAITATNKVLHLAADGSVLNASGVQASNGETVQTWVDQSAAANNATPKSGITPPVFVTNKVVGRPALQFTPNQLLQCVAPSASLVRDYPGDYTWFCVGQANALAYYGFMGTRTLGAFAKGAYLGNDNGGRIRYSNGLNASSTVGADMTGAWRIGEAFKAGAKLTLGVNGMTFADISARLPYTSDATIYFGVGAGNGGGNDSPDWMNGNLSEVLVYNGTISDADRMDIRRYLGDKYGITSFTADMPTVTLSNPPIYASKGSLVTFTVNTTTPLSSINNVEFFVNGVSAGLGTPDGTGNYSRTVTAPSTGRTFNIAAIATNNDTPTPRKGGVVRAVFNEPIYVSPAAVGLGDGSSWDNAATLASVLPYTNTAGGGLIFMSAGVHNLTASITPFTQTLNLEIYGGFKPPLIADLAARNATSYWNAADQATTISGQGLYRGFSFGASGFTAFTLDGVNFSQISGRTGVHGSLLDSRGATTTGTLTIRRCAFYDNYNDKDGIICVREHTKPGTTIIVDSCDFVNNNSTAYGGMLSLGGTDVNTSMAVSISNSNFSSNSLSANYDGGAVYAKWCTRADITTCTFTGNYSGPGGGSGGAVYLPNVTASCVSGCVFTGNYTRSGDGGAIRGNPVINFSIKDSTFTQNTGQSYGGAVRVDASTLTVTNCNFTQNKTNVNQGGAIKGDNAAIILDNCVFTQNFAKSDAGVIHMNQGTGQFCWSRITNCAFNFNSTGSGYAGAVSYRGFTGPVTITGSTFNTNSSATNGGAVYITTTNSPVGIADCDFYGNYTRGGNNGGAMEKTGTGVFTATNCNFTSNSSGTEGGGLRLDLGGTPGSVFTGCSFTSNTARGNNSGALRLTSTAASFYNCSFTGNKAWNGTTTYYDGGAIDWDGAAGTYGLSFDGCNFIGNIGKQGGAVLIWNSNGSLCPSTVTNCLFYNNLSNGDGGAYYHHNATPVVMDSCIINSNTTTAAGNSPGLKTDGATKVTVNNCVFTNNMAYTNWGGISLYNNPIATITSCVIKNNYAYNAAGYGGTAVACRTSTMLMDRCWLEGNYNAYDGGAVYIDNDASSVTIINCLIANNTAKRYGGALVRWNQGGLNVINSTFYGNRAQTLSNNGTLYSDGVFVNDSTKLVYFLNCLFDNHNAAYFANVGTNKGQFDNCLFGAAGRFNGANAVYWGNLVNPVFDYSLLNSDLTPANNSPAINAGAVAAFDNNAPLVDYALNGRPVGQFDIGAFESAINPPGPHTPSSEAVIRVSPTGTGAGTNWGADVANLDYALDNITVNGQIWMMTGDYSRIAATTISKPITIYGGFAGTENAVIERTPQPTSTTLRSPNGRNRLFMIESAWPTTLDTLYITSASTTANGGAIYAEGDLNLVNCSITSNSATTAANSEGGAIYCTRGMTLTADGCEFTNNLAGNRGGAISQVGGGGGGAIATTLTLTNCAFNFNKVPAPATGGGWGGAIRKDTSGRTQIINCVFESNTSQSDGGAINLCRGAQPMATSSLIVNTKFYNNKTATGQGGAGRFYRDSFTMTNCDFSSNTAGTTTIGPGGAFVIGSDNFAGSPFGLALDHCQFTSNTGNNGGAICQTDTAASQNHTTMTACTFTRNIAWSNQGGAFKGQDLGTALIGFYMEDCTFDSNIAAQAGAVWQQNGGMTGNAVVRCHFYNNNSYGNNSGAFCANGGSLAFDACDFIGNRACNMNTGAAYEGGALFAQGNGKIFNINNCIFRENFGNYAGALRGGNTTAKFNLTGCEFTSNAAVGANLFNPALGTAQGGAIKSDNVEWTITNCSFTSNTAVCFANGGGGGAIQIWGGGAAKQYQFTDCVFSGNNTSGGSADRRGGALWFGNGGNVSINRCLLIENSSYNGGALRIESDPSSVTIVNSIFSQNTAANYGGAIFRENRGGLRVVNSTFVDNIALTNANGAFPDGVFIAKSAGTIYFMNSLFDGHQNAVLAYGGPNPVTMVNCLMSGRGRLGGANRIVGGLLENSTYGLPGDALFNDPASFDYTLAADSRAINAGVATAFDSDAPVVDYAQAVRPFGATAVDLGAYESNFLSTNPPPLPSFPGNIIRVTTDAVAGDGSSWANPATLDYALANVTTNGQIWMKTGDYPMLNATTITLPIGIFGGFAGVDGVDVSTSSRIAVYGANYAQANPTTLTASGADRVFEITADAGAVVVDGLNFTNGYATNPGGSAIESFANMTIAQCIFANNTVSATSWRSGGALKLTNSITSITATQFVGNQAVSPGGGASGSAILCSGTTLLMDGCLVSNNTTASDGAMFFENSGAAIANSTISNNVSGGNGGGIRTYIGCDLTLTNCEFTTNTATAATGGAIIVDNNGMLNATACVFYGNRAQNGGAIRVANTTPCYLTSCVLTANAATAGDGGALYESNSGCLFNLTGCTFANNTATGLGGALRHGASGGTNSNVTMNGCVFDNNSASNNGGAMYVGYTSGTDNYTDCVFTNNRSPVAGGAAWLWKSATVATGCTFDGNSVTGSTGFTFGGAVFFSDQSGNTTPYTFNNCLFRNNTATDGGAVAGGSNDGTAAGNAAINFRGCEFTNNFARATGGAVRVQTGNFYAFDCTFNNNMATNDGGAMYINGALSGATTFMQLTAVNCLFDGNVSTNSANGGGAIYNINANQYLNNCIFTNNTAWKSSSSTFADGGAIYLASPGATVTSNTFDRCQFDGNMGLNGGAILMKNINAPLIIQNSVITRNQASGQGGAIRRLTTGKMNVINCTIANNIASGAQVSGHFADGIYVDSGNNANTLVANTLFDGQDLAFGGTAATSVTYCLYGAHGRNLFTNAVLDATPTYSVAGNPDPLFINAAAGNFDLASVSPAINAGGLTANFVGLTIPTVDILNLNRYLTPDIGAYEAAPGVIAINLADPNPAAPNVKTFTYVAQFNQPVAGVDVTDFQLFATGTIYGAEITGFEALSTTDYIVTATIQGGAGSLRLDEVDDGTVYSPNTNTRLNHGVLTNFIGQAYTVDYDASGVVITAIALAGANPTSAGPLVYQVSFSQPVQNIDVTDFQVVIGGAYTTQTVAPSVLSVSAAAVSSSVLVTVDAGVSQGDVRLDVLGTANIQDTVHSFALANIPYASGPGYVFDNFTPVVLALAPRASVTSATSIIYDLTFNEPVTTPTAGLLSLATDPQITAAAITDISDISGGERTSWTITVDGIVAAGAPGGALHVDLASTDVLDNLGNALATTQTGASVIVDQTAPSLLSIVAVGANPTPAVSVVFDVTFSEPVTGLTQGAFALNVIGGGGSGVISGLTGTGASYQVTVDTIVATKQDGALLQLDLMNAAGIGDQAGFPLNAPATNGQVTVDQLAPGFDPLANVEPSSDSVVDSISITTVTFNEPVVGVTTAVLTLTTDGVTIAAPLDVVNAFGDGRTYVFTIDDNYGSGPAQIILTVAGGVISDPAGNLFAGQQWSIIKDRNVIPVSLSSAQVDNGGLTSLTQIVLNAHFSAPVTGFDPLGEPGDLITSNCTVVAFSGANSDYLITVSPIAQGVVAAHIPTNVALNGTRRNGTSNLFTFTVDSIAPSFAGFAASPSRVKVGTTVTLTITASEPLAADATLTVNGHAASLAVAADPLYTFRYAPQALDAEGSATLSASGYDAAYNVGVTTDGIALYVDKTAPTATLTISSPDAGAVETITFSEEVTGVDISDFVLTRNGVPVAELSGLTKVSPTVYSINVGNTTPGLYVLTLVAASSGIQDLALIPMAVDATDTWQVAPAASAVRMWSRY